MTDESLNDKLERLLSLMEAQLELTRQGQHEEHLRHTHRSGEEAIEPSHPEDQEAREGMMGDPPTPSPASRPRQVVSFEELSELPVNNYDKYTSPTGPRYFRPRVELYNWPRAESHGFDQEDDASASGDPSLSRSKPVATPFPKFNPRDIEIFILEAEAWFKFNQVYEQARMINHMGAQLEGSAREWWTSKLHIDRGREGRLFNDWHYFTERLMEQFNPQNARMEAYNKLLALWLMSDAPGAATRHVEQFRDLEGQVNLDDNELVIDLFRGSLTWSLQEKFEWNPPVKRWEWYREVEEINQQRMLLQQSSAQHPSAAPSQPNPGARPMPPAQVASLIQAALEDGPIEVILLDLPPLSLLAFGFVPTGDDKGIEMEVEIDKEVLVEEIPVPYQHLRDVFDEVEANKLPHHTEHDLHLELMEDSRPPQGPLYLKGPKEMAELWKYLDENLAKGFIRPSKTPARSPVLFVPKKDGGLRLCMDYRSLNEITLKNRAPLPLIEEQLFLLRKAKVYMKLDLRAAYNLIHIAKGDEWKTAFGTQLGLYEYLVMPFSLANAPAHFQSFINHIFWDIIGVYVVVYLDDFLIFSSMEEEHVQHVTEVLM
ncbi:hypothetical protein NDA14_002239 [Ustilago hordei]|nr:hypothetical protein NDA14_002239 [Ustilago hordei]